MFGNGGARALNLQNVHSTSFPHIFGTNKTKPQLNKSQREIETQNSFSVARSENNLKLNIVQKRCRQRRRRQQQRKEKKKKSSRIQKAHCERSGTKRRAGKSGKYLS